jgi:hypothetical protein
MLKEAASYARMAWGIRAMVRLRLPDPPQAALRAQLENRATRFLDTLRTVVFADANHPYYRMFEEARCNFEDVSQMVQRRGLQPSLEALRQAGVWLSHDEFKGKQAILRNGRHIPADTASFENPLAYAAWEARSSGSRSTGTTVKMSPAFIIHRQCYYSLNYPDFGVQQRRWITLDPILPAGSGLARSILAGKSGLAIDRWYAVGRLQDSAHYRAVTRLMCAEASLLGARMPKLTFLPANDFAPAAEHLARTRANGAACFVTGMTSTCIRVAAAALEKGLDISGTRFQVFGEALTPAKAEVVRRAGAEVFATYLASELGTIGMACPHMEGSNTVHLFEDAVAAISHRRTAPGTDHPVESLLFTSLFPRAPYVLINLELGDHGLLGRAACDCGFSKFGFTTAIADIYSYTKLTGYGSTLVGTDILRILESALPARFGGCPGDYQLVEQEAGTETRMTLRVDPRVGNFAAVDVRDFFLEEVRKLYGGSLSTRTWRHAESMRVVLQPPLAGRTGKVLPLHLLGPMTAAKDAGVARR